MAIEQQAAFDWDRGIWVSTEQVPRRVYYEAHGGFDDESPAMVAQDKAAEAEGLKPRPDPDLTVQGQKLLHVAVNKPTHHAFGTPRMERMIRWWTAYNEVLESHVNRMKAMAKVLVKITADGASPYELQQLGFKAMKMANPLEQTDATITRADGTLAPAGAGGIAPGALTANQGVNMEPLKFDTGASDVAQSIPELRANFTGAFPPPYYGQQTNSLAGDQAVELPVLKFVEMDQEAWVSQLFGPLAQAAIDAGLRTGHISRMRPATQAELDQVKVAVENGDEPPLDIVDGQIERDLSFEVQMPSVLKRAMGDIVQAAIAVASAADPQGTNVEMTRWLVTYCMAEAFGVENPSKLVDQMFPKHVMEAEIRAQQEQQQQMADEQLRAQQQTNDLQRQQAAAGTATSTGADGKQHAASNPAGARQKSAPPEQKLREADASMITDSLALLDALEPS